MRSFNLILMQTQCLTLPPCGHVFTFFRVHYNSAQLEIPLCLVFRFGVRPLLSGQWLSAGNISGECDCFCAAEDPLWHLSRLLGFASGDVQDQVYLSGNEKIGQDKCFAYLVGFWRPIRATFAVAAITSYSFKKCSLRIFFFKDPYQGSMAYGRIRI